MIQPKFDTSYNQTWLPLQELAAKLSPNISPADWLRVSSAYEMAENVHMYQKRNDGTPYFWHCTRVVKIITHELELAHPNLIIAAILHASLEDSDILNYEILEYNFGSDVSSWVEVLTKQVRVRDEAEKAAINKEYGCGQHRAGLREAAVGAFHGNPWVPLARLLHVSDGMKRGVRRA